MPRRNNFDAFRLIAAISVLFTHAFVVAEGSQQNEPFVWLTDNQCPIGLVGVFVFFVISGYLVTQSRIETAGPGRFVVKRALRIFPALLASLVLCAFVLGPLVTSLPLGDYLHDPLLYRFLGRNALLELGDNPLPGVLFSTNSAGDTVNGSLWTLRYEVMMYLMVLLMGAVGLLRLWAALVLVALGVVAVLYERLLDPFGDLGEWAWFVGFFAAGMALYLARDWPPLRSRIVPLLALAGLITATRLHLFIALFPIFGSVLTIWCAQRYWSPLRHLRRFGDLSYGAYLWGWPVEECVMWASGGRAGWASVFLVSLPLTLGLGWLSWHGLEKRAVRLGHARPAPLTPPAPAE